MRVLVVEDETRLAEALGQILREEKHMVDVVYNGQDGLDYGRSGIYDIIIMDVMMPRMDGYQVTAQLRRDKINTPVLMLTAKDTVDNKIEGLDKGADDYMTKPFAPKELLARVRALTRRRGEVMVETVDFGDLSLSLSSCDLSSAGKSTHLSFKEFQLMKMLMTGGEGVTSKEEMLVKVWGYEGEATDNNVEAYISFLRKKLIFLNSKIEITALRKIGYKLEKGKV
ncbi:MAG: response regulator transcription factor [Clostridiales bacterium]|nr:response regulator transcription factor [Clostridiales bacterium]